MFLPIKAIIVYRNKEVIEKAVAMYRVLIFLEAISNWILHFI